MRYRRFQRLEFSRRSQDFGHQRLRILSLILLHTCWIVRVVPAEEVAEAYRDAGPEEGVACEGEVRVEGLIGGKAGISNFPLQDDGHNDPVDGHGFTEDDAG